MSTVLDWVSPLIVHGYMLFCYDVPKARPFECGSILLQQHLEEFLV